jgi:hypothetical protein
MIFHVFGSDDLPIPVMDSTVVRKRSIARFNPIGMRVATWPMPFGTLVLLEESEVFHILHGSALFYLASSLWID